jgi:MoxR-like ATPase
MCRIAVGYQSMLDETTIVERAVAGSGDVGNGDVDWIGLAVELVRATRSHPDVRVGSSVRGAIDMVFVANSLAELRELPVLAPRVSLDAALVALSGRIRVREGTSRTPEAIITELWESVFNRSTGEGGDDPEGKAIAPTGATTSP